MPIGEAATTRSGTDTDRWWPVLLAGTRLIVAGTGKSGTSLPDVAGERTVVTDAPGTLMTLVRPDEPVLADRAELPDLLAGLHAPHADVA